jgi:hypothetical protein
MPTLSILLLSSFAATAVLAAAYIFLIGLPPAVKRSLQRQALTTVGENKAGAMVKSQIERIPEEEHQVSAGLHPVWPFILARLM